MVANFFLVKLMSLSQLQCIFLANVGQLMAKQKLGQIFGWQGKLGPKPNIAVMSPGHYEAPQCSGIFGSTHVQSQSKSSMTNGSQLSPPTFSQLFSNLLTTSHSMFVVLTGSFSLCGSKQVAAITIEQIQRLYQVTHKLKHGLTSQPDHEAQSLTIHFANICSSLAQGLYPEPH